MKIVTGYQGKAHITSNDDQGRNQGIFGTDSYVTSVGQQFAATLVNANELDIADGEGVMQGVHFRIEPGEVDAAKLQNGTSGMKRIDLVVARYTKDSSTGIENVSLVVIKGTESSSTPAVPAYNSGEILKGKNTVDFPLYKVTYNGINVSSVDRMFTKLQTMAELQTAVNKLNTEIVTQEFSIGSADNSNYYGEFLYYVHIPTSIISKKIISYNVVSSSGVGVIRSVNLNDDYLIMTTNSNSNNGKVKFRFVLQSKS
ncbi:hypothetical protein [Bilifractor porci]|uniref:Uncharacterized protein n=1 Tax=Bilifractor porci TaxID=2606636 RepID=A0A7X2P6G4_9FIRM|nr:hypothetical protein [Bilifractor porci]MST81122.1 hypothetical protein [Bilifractor porci]